MGQLGQYDKGSGCSSLGSCRRRHVTRRDGRGRVPDGLSHDFLFFVFFAADFSNLLLFLGTSLGTNRGSFSLGLACFTQPWLSLSNWIPILETQLSTDDTPSTRQQALRLGYINIITLILSIYRVRAVLISHWISSWNCKSIEQNSINTWINWLLYCSWNLNLNFEISSLNSTLAREDSPRLT